MKQNLIIETTEKAFLEAMDKQIKEGFKVIAGSTLITSLPSVITLDKGEVLNDLNHVFTVAVTGKFDYMIYSKNVETFRKEVNDKLIQDCYNLVTGSLNVSLIKLDGFEQQPRVYITYYCCALYKE